MKLTSFLREKALERLTTARNERDGFELFTKFASEEFGGICFVGAAHRGRPSSSDVLPFHLDLTQRIARENDS